MSQADIAWATLDAQLGIYRGLPVKSLEVV